MLRASGIARRRTEPGWRAAVLDERTRKAAANKFQPQRAERATYTERAEAFFLCERRRRRRIPSAMREQHKK